MDARSNFVLSVMFSMNLGKGQICHFPLNSNAPPRSNWTNSVSELGLSIHAPPFIMA